MPALPNSTPSPSGFHKEADYDPDCATCQAFKLHLEVAQVLAEGRKAKRRQHVTWGGKP